VDVEPISRRAREQFPGVPPRITSDNGPQFVAKDFKEFIRVGGMTHVKPSPYDPQSNGTSERCHRTIKGDGRRTETPRSLADARRRVARPVEQYNTVRLHSAIGYVTPGAKLQGRDRAIRAERDRKLETARERRKQNRPARRQAARDGQPEGAPT
jgi:transposase InsO family protein